MFLGDTITKVRTSPRNLQTISPRERVGSGDETNSGDAWLELSLPTICRF